MTKAYTRLTKPSARHWSKSTKSGNLDSILRDAKADPGQTNTSNFIDRSFRHYDKVVMTKDEEHDLNTQMRDAHSNHQTLKEMMPDRRNVPSGGSRATHRNKKNKRTLKKTRRKTNRRRR